MGHCPRASGTRGSLITELKPIPQFKTTAKLGQFLEGRFSQSFEQAGGVGRRAALLGTELAEALSWMFTAIAAPRLQPRNGRSPDPPNF
jgi:hypothetical protein